MAFGGDGSGWGIAYVVVAVTERPSNIDLQDLNRRDRREHPRRAREEPEPTPGERRSEEHRWCARRDSNSRPVAPEATALSS